MRELAERGVERVFTQVFRDSFFHAEMHPARWHNAWARWHRAGWSKCPRSPICCWIICNWQVTAMAWHRCSNRKSLT
jgi:hypothetical protein